MLTKQHIGRLEIFFPASLEKVILNKELQLILMYWNSVVVATIPQKKIRQKVD